MGIRLLVAARKSRSGNKGENARYARQEYKNRRTAEASGHTVVDTVHDTVSSQTLPWKRKNLRTWFTNPDKLALWDAVLISEVARISRGDSDTWFEIEQFCRANHKFVMDASGLLWPSADDKEWDDKRRGAREYWEAVRDSHADTRQHLLAVGAAIGIPPFGYTTEPCDEPCDECGATHKRFVPNPDTAPVALECFRAVARGESGNLVAAWLGVQLGRNIRAQRIVKMINSDSYLGRRDTHDFATLADDMPELITTARARLAERSFDRGGKRVTHAYSSRIYCACGANLNHHQSTGSTGKQSAAKYRCSRGRRGISGEARCEFGAFPYDATNEAVDAAVSRDLAAWGDGVTVTTGGDAARKAELDSIAKNIDRAVASRDMARVGELSASYAALEAQPAAAIETHVMLTGKSVAERFTSSTLDQRREMLAGDVHVTVTADGVSAAYDFTSHPINEA